MYEARCWHHAGGACIKSYKGDEIDETRRLLIIDDILKVVVKKHILHVQLVNRPRARDEDAQYSLDHCRLDDGSESLVVIDDVLLRETSNKPDVHFCCRQVYPRSGTYP